MGKAPIGITLFSLWLYAMGFIAGYVVGAAAYRQGQIDALTGDVRYHLVDKPDGTREWERIAQEGGE